jgi:hypothetical protein
MAEGSPFRPDLSRGTQAMPVAPQHTIYPYGPPEKLAEDIMSGGGRALVANDVFGSAHAADDSRLLGWLIVSHIAVPGHHLGIPRIYRWRFITDIAAVRKFAGDLATIPDLRLITVSHGDPVLTDPAGALRSVAVG